MWVLPPRGSPLGHQSPNSTDSTSLSFPKPLPSSHASATILAHLCTVLVTLLSFSLHSSGSLLSPSPAQHQSPLLQVRPVPPFSSFVSCHWLFTLAVGIPKGTVLSLASCLCRHLSPCWQCPQTPMPHPFAWLGKVHQMAESHPGAFPM